MKNKFDADHEFDKAARDAFENFELPFDNKDWESFQTAYEEDKKKNYKFFLGRSILNNKGWILAILASVSACFIGYAFQFYADFNSPKTATGIEENVNKEIAKGLNHVVQQEEVRYKHDQNTLSANYTKQSPNLQHSNSYENTIEKSTLENKDNLNSKSSQASKALAEKPYKDKHLAAPISYNNANAASTNQQDLGKEKVGKDSHWMAPKANSAQLEEHKKQQTNKATQQENLLSQLPIAQVNFNEISKPNSLSQNNNALINPSHSNENSLDLTENITAATIANTSDLSAKNNTINNASKEAIILENIALNTQILAAKKKKDPGFELRKTEPLKPFIPQFRLGLMTGIENYANNSYGQSTIGFTFGVLGERTFSKLFSVQAGININSRKYEKTHILDEAHLTTSVAAIHENLNTHLFLFQIPIQLQWELFNNKQWRIYAQTGINTYLNFSQHYSGIREIAFEQNGSITRFSSNIGMHEYQGAFLQTKSLKNNIFFTAQVGLGIERRLSDTWSLFVQPHMQYLITPMNTANDKGHILAFHVGAKTTLK